MQEVRLNFFSDKIRGGWLDFSQKPSFSFRKSICTADRFVVLNFSQHFFWREKIRRPKKRLRQAYSPMAKMHDGAKSLAIENARAESAAGYIKTSASLPRPE